MNGSGSIKSVLCHTIVSSQSNNAGTGQVKVLEVELGGGCRIACIDNFHDEFAIGLVDGGRREDSLRIIVLQYRVEDLFVVEPHPHTIAIHLQRYIVPTASRYTS